MRRAVVVRADAMLESMFDTSVLAPRERVRPLLRKEYEELVNRDFFEDERVELLRGVLVEMSPQGVPHSRITAWLAQLLSSRLPFDIYDVRGHSPFAATEDSEPEPDVSVSHRRPASDENHPSVAQLLIEVSGSSFRKDNTIKREIYAEAGVPEYWIVNLKTSTIEVLTEPRGMIYTASRIVTAGELRPLLLDVVVDVDRIPWAGPGESTD
jgi:Uma2 family endonuclease